MGCMRHYKRGCVTPLGRPCSSWGRGQAGNAPNMLRIAREGWQEGRRVMQELRRERGWEMVPGTTTAMVLHIADSSWNDCCWQSGGYESVWLWIRVAAAGFWGGLGVDLGRGSRRRDGGVIDFVRARKVLTELCLDESDWHKAFFSKASKQASVKTLPCFLATQTPIASTISHVNLNYSSLDSWQTILQLPSSMVSRINPFASKQSFSALIRAPKKR